MENKYGVIYLVVNKVNDKVYVGQTIRTFKDRYNGDIFNNTHNEHLKRAFNKYGVDAFYIVDEYDSADSKEALDELEKYYIGMLGTMDSKKGYNKTDGGGGCTGYTHNIESRRKIGEAKKGVKRSLETREKVSKNNAKTMQGKTGDKHPNSKRVLQIDLVSGEVINSFGSLREIDRVLSKKGANSYIVKVCKGEKSHAYGYRWAYYEDFIKVNTEILAEAV